MTNSDFPDFDLYAILKNNIVVDCGTGNTEKVIASLQSSNRTYSKQDGFEFVVMTLENSPAFVGMKYNGKQFYFEGETNG